MLIEFTCGRCGTTHVEPFEYQAQKAEENLQSFVPPPGWKNDTLFPVMLCPKCYAEYREFMSGGNANAK